MLCDSVLQDGKRVVRNTQEKSSHSYKFTFNMPITTQCLVVHVSRKNHTIQSTSLALESVPIKLIHLQTSIPYLHKNLQLRLNLCFPNPKVHLDSKIHLAVSALKISIHQTPALQKNTRVS